MQIKIIRVDVNLCHNIYIRLSSYRLAKPKLTDLNMVLIC